MIENGLILTGNDADLPRRTLSEVKTKVYQESEASLDDTQALDVLLSCLLDVGDIGPQKRRAHQLIKQTPSYRHDNRQKRR